MTDNQARDDCTEAELALDEKGKFLALRMRHITGHGRLHHAGRHSASTTNNFARCLPACTTFRRSISRRSACSPTPRRPGPIAAPAGRRRITCSTALVEEAARITGIDRAELRKKNLIPKSAMPYKTAVSTTYDSGDFPAIFAKAMEIAEFDGFNEAQARSRRATENCAASAFPACWSTPAALPTEGALLQFPGGDTLIMGMNVQSTGQGHATVFGRVLAEQLGIPRGQIVHKHGDSALEIPGFAVGRLALGHGGDATPCSRRWM